MPVDPHYHNNTDSPRIRFNDLLEINEINATAVAGYALESGGPGKTPTWTKIGGFGGNGSDGALSIASGTTNIDLGAAGYVEKNYTSISITGTGKLTFSNPHSLGTVIVLRSQGNVTLTSSTNPLMDASGMGGVGGAGGSLAQGVTLNGGNGGGGGAGAVTAGSNGTLGGAGGTGGTAPGNGSDGSARGWLGGTNGVGTKGLATAATAGSGGLSSQYPTNATQVIRYFVSPGAGGGGGSGSNNGTSKEAGGAGSAGGGGVWIECAGALNFTGTITAAGIAGTNTSLGGGAGGGGGGGTITIIYNTLTANSGTLTVTGGNGGTNPGTAGAPGGPGGAGGNGFSNVSLNTQF